MLCIYCGGAASWVGPVDATYAKCSRCGATDCTSAGPDGEEDEEGDGE